MVARPGTGGAPLPANDPDGDQSGVVTRLRRDVGAIERDLQQLQKHLRQLDAAPVLAADATSPWSRPDALHLRAAAIHRERRRRDEQFGEYADIFADAAYDILLDLYAAEGANKRVSVSSLCIAAAVPPTTALRYISLMQARGLLVRVSDDHDRRRAYLFLTPVARALMGRWLSSVS